MATTFPTTLDDFTNPQASDKTDSPSHAGQHADLNDAVEALEAKVGVDSSAVTTSHDYKLANLTVGDITDLTATAEELNTLDGITADVNELNILEGVTATTAELNIVDEGDTAQKVLNSQAKADVYLLSNQSVNSSTYTKVPHDTENYDIGSNFDNTTNYRFTAPVAGYYSVTCTAHVGDLGDGKQIISLVYKNGSVVASGKGYSAGANNDPGGTATRNIYLESGDYIEHYVWHDHGSSRSVLGGNDLTYMSVHLLSI